MELRRENLSVATSGSLGSPSVITPYVWPPVQMTVGTLKALLAEHPDDMPVVGTWEGQIEAIREVFVGVDANGKAGLIFDVDSM